MAASMSIFPAVFFHWSRRWEQGGWWEEGGGVGDKQGGGWTDELMAFYCVLQDCSLAGIVLCFPEDTSQLLEANVN